VTVTEQKVTQCNYTSTECQTKLGSVLTSVALQVNLYKYNQRRQKWLQHPLSFVAVNSCAV